ncbi:MAG: hypothetical protein R3D71_08305 [Rickettsiales bacterium]
MNDSKNITPTFNAQANGTSKSVSDPVSKAELDARISQRETPKPQYNLTPDGAEYSDLKNKLAKENEQRIQFIQKRLNDLENTATRDFNHARKLER